MKGLVYIERTDAFRTTREEFNPTEEFISHLEATERELSIKFADNNKSREHLLLPDAGMCQLPIVWVHSQELTRSKPWYCGLVKTMVMDLVGDLYNRQEALNFIDNQQEFTLSTVRSVIAFSKGESTIQPKGTFPWKLSINSGQLSYRYTIMDMAKISNGILCSECNNIVSAGSFSNHLGSFKCLRDSMSKDMVEQGWDVVDDNSIVAVRKAGLKNELRPTKFDMWVEPWVIAAIKTYRENKGFADMTLTEYLVKAAPSPNK